MRAYKTPRSGLVFVAAVVGISVGGCNSDELARTGCDLAKPPPSAGEMSSHGLEFRIYPRAVDMISNYTGCQVVWGIDADGTVTKIKETRYFEGKAVRYTDYMPDGKSVPLTCEYRDGRLLGMDKRCPTFAQANARETSLPAGCLASVATSSSDAHQPCFEQLQ